MEVTVQKKDKNPLFNRIEVSVTIMHEKKATPSRLEILNKVAKIVESDPKLCTVRELRTAYGSNYSTALVHVYSDEKSLKEFEPPHLVDRTLKSLGLKEATKPKPKKESSQKAMLKRWHFWPQIYSKDRGGKKRQKKRREL